LKRWKKRTKKKMVCRCGQAPCVFFEHEELVEYDDAEYGLTTSVEPILRTIFEGKKLYRQLTLMLNGGPLGAESGSRCRAAVSRNQRYTPLWYFYGLQVRIEILSRIIKIVDVGK
jgi:hypothetical protein